MNNGRVEHWIRQAFEAAPDCPPAEAFLRASLEAMSHEQREAIERHADQCPACASERELARTFDEAPSGVDRPGSDVSHVVSRLEHARAKIRQPERVRKPARTGWSWGLVAAAACVLVVAVVATLYSPAPPLPEPTGDSVLRGSRLDVSRPVGVLDAMPDRFEWTAVSGAAEYRVRLIEVDDSVLYETTVRDAALDLPQTVRARMHRAVVYYWSVEALDADGRRLAWTDRVQFRVRPGK